VTPIGSLVLGLGLFFLGMQLAGENLRRLSSGSYHPLGARLGGSPWAAGLLGIVFGAMMQSATAVTFVATSMVGSGVMRAEVARPVIVWCNVGLTVLAFLVTLSIHNLVAIVVGLSGIAAGMLRRRWWKAAALLALGLSLILFGLQTMSEGVAPVRQQPWFQQMLAVTAAAPPAAFLAGVLIAMLLQSNTGATLLIIALAGAGTFTLPQAMLLIYGTNLGAIALRALLAAELTGTARQLVRLEDLFCLWSGALMGALYALEFAAGVPLVAALVERTASGLPLQLALVFLLSNLLPALTMTPALGWCAALLARLWPAAPGEHAAVPRYLTSTALGDPGSALALLGREIARLLDHIRPLLSLPVAERDRAAENATMLAARVEGFIDDLAQRELSVRDGARLTVLRDALSSARLLLESVLTLARAASELGAEPAAAAAVCARLRTAADDLIALTRPALSGDQPEAIERLRAQARAHGPFVEAVRADCLAAGGAPATRLALLAVLSDFERVAWVLHRLGKSLTERRTAKTP
jgi:phosphate:Na+ symporter